ncbi:unnamed protein product [Effrenium voratum]|uniref:Transmembrane protein n=1 Tax=Effrenium voratum TaxID=2562239 RepID=A0AA36NKE4_9DINO|nr:unnamed protein product [Effrenium voratum]
MHAGRVAWLLLLLWGADSIAAENRSARVLKEKDKKPNRAEVVKRLKATIARLQEEKQSLSSEVKINAEAAAAKANQIAELSNQLSEQSKTIARLRGDMSQKNPSPAAGQAEVDSKRVEKLTAEASKNQQEIAELTAQVSALKIEKQRLEEEFGDPSLQYFLAAKATKVYQDPGIQGARNKTFKYVLPHVADALKTGTEVYSAMNSSLLEGMHSLLGADSSVEPWLPTMSAFLVYGMICCPLGLVLSYCAEWVCNTKELLLGCGFYLVSVSVLSVGFVAATQRDPLKELANHDPTVLLLQQVGFVSVLLAYLVLLAVATLSGAANFNLNLSMICGRFFQRLGCSRAAGDRDLARNGKTDPQNG